MNGDSSEPPAQQLSMTKPEAGSGDVGSIKAAVTSNGSHHINNVSPKKHKDSSSPSKHKDGPASPSKHRDGSSSSSSKHRDGSSSSSSSKHHSSKTSLDKSRDGSSSSSKHKSSSSSSKHSSREHSSSSKSSSSHKHKDHKHKDKPRPVPSVMSETISVKTETLSPVKAEIDEDDQPLSSAPKNKRADSDDENMSLAKKVKKEVSTPDKRKSEKEAKKAKKRKHADDDEDFTSSKKKKSSESSSKKKDKKSSSSSSGRSKVKKEEPQEVWKWWEEEKLEDGTKWRFLEHKGPVCAPAYIPLPKEVKLKYDGEKMTLSQDAEEVAGFYSRMIEHEYTTKDIFNKNFFKDWRKVMTEKERATITDLKKCDFRAMHAYFQDQSEKRKAATKEEKKARKEENEDLIKEYGFCSIDGHKEKIGNFRIEPPGLFRGRGDHPKMGMLKRRVNPEDVIINCSKDAKVPRAPEGHKWKKVQHDNTVSWLASWTENVQGQVKYVMLNASSRLKGEKDWQKYEIARGLHKIIDRVRATYREDLKSKEMRVRQRAVAMYFIDKLALRAGNEKETDETADTVGCCSLRVEHIKLHDNVGEKECVVEFDFLGKDSIRYSNSVPVEKRVYKNLKLFMDHKQPGDDLFDRLNTTILNKHLSSIMDGLSAKVFRTYNASRTLQEQLTLLTKEDDTIPAKLLSYNRANRAVAILCNHQRAAPKNFGKQMENMIEKIKLKKKAVKDAKRQVKDAKADLKSSRSEGKKALYEKKKKTLARLEEQLTKLEVAATDKEENKEIALGTSKLNYLDPRISVAWCKKWEVPIEKIYNKTQREKFRWAIDMATADYEFTNIKDIM